jgi:formate dehydrogenase subunit gamma
VTAEMFFQWEGARYAGYRLDDLVFWGLPLLAFLVCAVHAARRAFRQPTPTEGEGTEGSLGQEEAGSPEGRAKPVIRRVMVRYTAAQRAFHWANAAICITLLLSGLAIYSPGLFAGSLPTATWFGWHRWLAVVLMGGIVFHAVYGAYIHDSLAFMWFDRDMFNRLVQIAKNFLGLSPVYPKYTKYHPMQMGTHWMIAGSLFALIITGLILWRPTRILLPLDLLGLGWDFIYFCRTLHGFFAGAFLALLIGHLYFAVMIKKNWIMTKSMFTGRVDYDYYVRSHEVFGETVVEKGVRGSDARA